MAEDRIIYTRILSTGEVEVVLKGLPDLLWEVAGDCILTAEYGTECNIHNDLQYMPMQVGTTWLGSFLAESIEQRIFIPGKSDLSVMTPAGGLTVLFCHESDIHLSGSNAALIEKVCQSELFQRLLKT